MAAHPSQFPASAEETKTNLRSGDGTSNLLALADAIEACLQINEMPEDPQTDDRGVLLESTVAEIAALTSMPGSRPAGPIKSVEPRQLMTQPLAVQPKPTAIFASRLPQPEGGPRPAHFVAAPGIDLPQRAQIAAVKITTPAAKAVAVAVPEPRKQTLFVQPPKRRSKAPWIAAVAVLVAAVGVGGYMERGKLQQLRANMSAKSATTQQVAQATQAPVAAPVVATPAEAPVATPATPAADPVVAAATRVKHRETHRQAKADPKPATDSTPAAAPQADAKPDTKAEAKADAPAKKKNATEDEMKKASDALLKAQLDSAI